MNSDILFSEQQKFKQWWLWTILIGVNALFLYGVMQQLVRGQPFGDNPMNNTGLLLVTCLVLTLTILFLNFRLETLIKKDGIYIRFFPLHRRLKRYPWDTISKVYLRTYSPIMEYGGWGIRIGLFGKGSAYNVSGNKGLQLEFNNGKKLLIGTNKPDELMTVLQKLENHTGRQVGLN